MAKQDLHDMYYQEQKQGIVEIFVTLRLPVNLYEAGAGLYRLADYRSFDDYVSDCVVSDLETMGDGQVADDLVCKKITRKNSRWMQNEKEKWSGFLKRQKERDKIQKRTHCQNCGEWLEGMDTCSQCGRINK